jgi:anti-anti-sigma factor
LVALRDEAGAYDGAATIVRDIRQQHMQETERARLQEEIIQMQQLALRELSTPLLMVGDGVVVLPLVGSIDSRRAQQVIETLLQGISTTGAGTAILDITGVPVVDTQVANALLRAAQAVRLIGAQVVLTGIRPEVAQTLVGLGADMREIVSRGTLQSGIAYAMGAHSAAGGKRV